VFYGETGKALVFGTGF